MLSVSNVFSHCFFIAYKDVMKGTEKKRIYPIFLLSQPKSLMKQ
jgi:hypothetical protein